MSNFSICMTISQQRLKKLYFADIMAFWRFLAHGLQYLLVKAESYKELQKLGGCLKQRTLIV